MYVPVWFMILVSVLAGPTVAVLVLLALGKARLVKRSDDKQGDTP